MTVITPLFQVLFQVLFRVHHVCTDVQEIILDKAYGKEILSANDICHILGVEDIDEIFKIREENPRFGEILFKSVKYFSFSKLPERKLLKLISFFPKLESLDLSYTKVADASALGGVHTLYLSHCINIRDV